MVGPAVLRALRTLRPQSVSAVSARFQTPVESVLSPSSCVQFPSLRCCPVRSLQLHCALCAGHNKWSKVRHIKGPKDDARARVFTKLGMMIKVAVKEGGSNPDMNINLAHIVEQCRSKNMPKASIEAAIRSAEKAKPTTLHMVEARGPGGCLLLIEVLTDNTSRSNQDIRRILLKNGGMLSEGARHNYNRRGVVVVPGQDLSMERALELAIEAGAEDVKETEDEEEKPLLQFVCDMTDVHKVRASLVELGMQVTSSGLEFVPHTLLSLDQDQMDAASILIEALNDCPDVVRVWDNIQAGS
ncbi:translational activator of cytochrome c oxidase 1 [Cheilinus undulatus]|uniref:translational activator of cytochrome c oxidase 1 n=1 Tax=Cheilinus undulatus TaxID=241271 RepID=UPI001BD66B50|nr:translational activator of cytochrome c oxidase 1 [Cheilinus undulatus]